MLFLSWLVRKLPLGRLSLFFDIALYSNLHKARMSVMSVRFWTVQFQTKFCCQSLHIQNFSKDRFSWTTWNFYFISNVSNGDSSVIKYISWKFISNYHWWWKWLDQRTSHHIRCILGLPRNAVAFKNSWLWHICRRQHFQYLAPLYSVLKIKFQIIDKVRLTPPKKLQNTLKYGLVMRSPDTKWVLGLPVKMSGMLLVVL